jgi:hypothetical protein
LAAKATTDLQTEEGRMLQNLAADIINCYERARQARDKAERAISDAFKADFVAAEGRWLALAHEDCVLHGAIFGLPGFGPLVRSAT